MPRMELMLLNFGLGSSTTILTGANVIDIGTSEYSIYVRIHV